MIRPVRNEEDHAEALMRIEELWSPEPGSPQEDELEVLITLVHAYEEAHHPIGPPDPIEAIRFRMEQESLSPKDLVRYMGGANRVSEVLHRKRGLSLRMIRELHRGLGIPADVLIQPSKVA